MVTGSTKYLSSLTFCLRKSKKFLNDKMRLPERWLDYSFLGKQLEGTPFICFKTPLSEQFSTKYSPIYGLKEEEEFKPFQVCEEIQKKGYKLGLVIDLTNTFRYYDGKKEFEQDQGVQYVKLKFNGYEPRCYDRVFQIFADTINNFLKRRVNDNLIGVHCTHGVNRTGYLVCRYMIDVLNHEPKDAIKLFNDARGHSIEKECFLRDLPLRWLARKEGNVEGLAHFGGRSSNAEGMKSHKRYNQNEYNNPDDFVIEKGPVTEYSERLGKQQREMSREDYWSGDQYKKYVDNWRYYPDPNEHYYHEEYNDWQTVRYRKTWKEQTYPNSGDQGSWRRSENPSGRQTGLRNSNERHQEPRNRQENSHGKDHSSWSRNSSHQRQYNSWQQEGNGCYNERRYFSKSKNSSNQNNDKNHRRDEDN